jgi:adenosylcobinamide-phosphate synthase
VPADPWIVLAAAAAEAALGYPARLHEAIPHPVAWVARQIRSLERELNRGGPIRQRFGGVLTLTIVAATAGAFGLALHLLFARIPGGVVLTALVGSLGLAGRSLYTHVVAVASALSRDDLPAARLAVGAIVGRDVEQLDAEGVAAAALESLAESFNDGVVAPLFWFVLGGLPGLFAYKAVNTADSLIGHKEDPYFHFGWASARMDDLMNLVPARLSGAVLALAGFGGWRVMWREARKHASPNSGWPEAAMAGALKIQLGGSAAYDGVIHDRPTFGAGPRPTRLDLDRGVRLYLRACAILVAALAAGGVYWPR